MTSVSFIITVYNKSKYLKAVINSIRNQSGNFEKEYIFINDGSTDDSADILQKETKNLKNCKIINQKNMGSANATNVGIFSAKKKYIKFLDADDLIVNAATESMISILEKNESSVLVSGLQTKVERFDDVNLCNKINKKNITIIEKPLIEAMTNSMFNPSQFLVRTDVCKLSGGCDERIKFSQEYSLTLRLALYGKFIRLNQITAILPKKAPGQISEKKYNQIYRVSKALEFFLKDNNDLDLDLKLFGLRRLTGRSWRFAKRNIKANIFSRWFFLYLLGLFRIKKNLINNCEKANEVYENFLD